MASVASPATVTSSGGDGRVLRSGLGEAAWLCALPCAAIVVCAILVLGHPLGRLLTPAESPYTFLPSALLGLRPEPAEHAGYLIALCAPLLATLAVATAARWQDRVPAALADRVVVGTQLALAATVVASLAVQYGLRFGVVYTRGIEDTVRMRYFTPATLAVAAALALATAVVLRVPRLRAAASRMTGESRTRRTIVAALAIAATAIWMLHAVHSDAEIANAEEDVRYHLGFTLDETFAVLNGLTPLADFTTQYGALWPFAIAVTMLAFGKSVLVYTAAASAITSVALLAVYGVLRRATRSAAAALLLFLPFLATSLFEIEGSIQNRSSIGNYYGTFPLRYALPFLLAWLTARHLDRGRESLVALWGLFAVAGLGVLNNTEFGVAALGATVAALVWVRPPQGPRGESRRMLRLGLGLLLGVVTAFASVAVLTSVRAGSLPDPARLFEFARAYAVAGFAMMPIPAVVGVHLLVYLTYVAAIVAGTVRTLRAARNRVLTGMLVWAGVFGLGAGTYWVGRSHPVALKHEFSAWALALALLTVVAVRQLAATGVRRRSVAALVAVFGFGVMACSLAQTPTPWGQLERLNAPFVPTYESPDPEPLVPPSDPETRRFVASLADGRSRFVMRRGAPVAVLLTTGHRVAEAYGVRNVSPHTGIESMYTAEWVEDALDALRDAGGNTVITPVESGRGIVEILQRRGFELLTQRGLRPLGASGESALDLVWPGGGAIVKWVDAHQLHPRALR